MLLAATLLAVHLTSAATPPARIQRIQQTANAHQTITLAVGGSTQISFVGVRNFSLADAGVVDVIIDKTGKAARVTGRRTGVTTLTVRHDDGSMLVYDVFVS